ncbi:MAG TPA: hypothetical protein VIG07_17980 [Methylomirabilota bacterium]|jgi:hypothetical protein
MPSDGPIAVGLLFVATVVATLLLVLWGAARAARRVGPGAMRGVRVAGLALAGWLALTAALADRGFFEDFYSLPPHMLLAIGPPLLVLLALTFAGRLDALLAALPRSWPVGAQAFRIVVEIVLWRLAVAGVAPEIVTFTGRNVDILVGLSAPAVAYFCFVTRAWPERVAVWWNVAGIVILLNVVVHAQLSAPTRFRVFETEPPTTFIGAMPYIWLPAVLVPLAWLLHAVSLRQLRARR